MNHPIQRVLNTRGQTRSFYDRLSRAYDLLAEHSEGPVRRKGLAMLHLQPGERVLEVGCGTGHCLVEMARSVSDAGQVFGIDLSAGMLLVSRRRLEESALAERVALFQGDASALPLASNRLDAVFLSFTLELFDTPEIPRVLGECRRVLRPGGRIGVVGMTREDEHGVAVDIYEWAHLHFPNFVDCRPIYVREAIQSAGFVIEQAEHQRMWVPVEAVTGRKPGSM